MSPTETTAILRAQLLDAKGTVRELFHGAGVANMVITTLRARIEEMERQEPFDADSDVFRSSFEAALKAGNWPATRQGDGYRSPSTQIAWRIAFSTVNRLKLYLAPGARRGLSTPDMLESLRCACNYIDKLGGVSQQYRAMLAAAPEAKP